MLIIQCKNWFMVITLKIEGSLLIGMIRTKPYPLLKNYVWEVSVEKCYPL